MPNNESKRTVSRGSTLLRAAPLLICAIVLIAAFFFFVPVQERLVIRNMRTGALYRTLPIARGETFGILYTHSLNLSDVTDTVEWTGEALVCRSTLFTTYGAGIPDLPDGIGTAFTVTEDGFLLSGIDKAQTRIPIMLQTVPDHRLLYRGETIDLMKRYGSGTSIELLVRGATPFELLFYA